MGRIIIAYLCLRQFDLKKIVAFSSVSHIRVIMGSLFRLYSIGKLGRIFIMLGHGLISSSIFLCLGVLYYRYFSRNYFLLNRIIILLPSFAL